MEHLKTGLILGAILAGVVVTVVGGHLASSFVQLAQNNGAQIVNEQIAQVVASTEKTCQPADLGTAIILSKKCTDKPAETPQK